MNYEEFIDELYDTTVEHNNLKNIEKDVELTKRDDELSDVISNAMTEKYGAEKALDIINEQFDTQCTRERVYHIATFKSAIQIGFMLAKLLSEIDES